MAHCAPGQRTRAVLRKARPHRSSNAADGTSLVAQLAPEAREDLKPGIPHQQCVRVSGTSNPSVIHFNGLAVNAAFAEVIAWLSGVE